MTFVRVIDCKTSRFDEMNQIMEDWVEQTRGKRTATHSVIGKDRSDSSHFIEIVEFPSHEAAMRNAHLPETEKIFRDLVALCDGMPTFTDLDVVRDEQLYTANVRRFFETLAAGGELPPLNDLITEDCHSHDPASAQDTIGLDALRREYEMWRSAFDSAYRLDDVIAQGDRVCALWTWNATHKGEFLGITSTGRDVTMSGMTLFRFGGDGKIAEMWWQRDQLGLMEQLGALDALE